MAIGIDTSKWKPRKLKGTPAGNAINIIGGSVLTVGLLVGVFYQYSNVTEKFRKALDRFYTDPIEEVERKLMIASGISVRSGDTIRKILDEEARTDLPDK